MDSIPCLIVNDWNEVTEEFLLEKKEECGNIHELLLQM